MVMVRVREVVSAAIVAVTLVAGLGGKADAAQCGSSSAGFEAWKREFADEARAKGVGATAVAALMQTNYASATIAADRSQSSFSCRSISSSPSAAPPRSSPRGRALKQSQGALFASIQQRYGVPPGPLLAIWGMETGFGSQRGNQNMLSSIATLAYDCRRHEFFTDQLYAALKLIDRGVLSGATRGSMHGEVGQTQFMPKNILAYGTGNLDVAANALNSTANFLQSPWLARRRRLPARRSQFRRDPGLERRRRLSESHRADGQADRRRSRERRLEPAPLRLNRKRDF